MCQELYNVVNTLICYKPPCRLTEILLWSLQLFYFIIDSRQSVYMLAIITLSAILVKKMSMMITNKLSRTPTVPMMTLMTLIERSRTNKTLGVSSTSFDEDVVKLFQTSVDNDEFSISNQRSLTCLNCLSSPSFFWIWEQVPNGYQRRCCSRSWDSVLLSDFQFA